MTHKYSLYKFLKETGSPDSRWVSCGNKHTSCRETLIGNIDLPLGGVVSGRCSYRYTIVTRPPEEVSSRIFQNPSFDLFLMEGLCVDWLLKKNSTGATAVIIPTEGPPDFYNISWKVSCLLLFLRHAFLVEEVCERIEKGQHPTEAARDTLILFAHALNLSHYERTNKSVDGILIGTQGTSTPELLVAAYVLYRFHRDTLPTEKLMDRFNGIASYGYYLRRKGIQNPEEERLFFDFPLMKELFKNGSFDKVYEKFWSGTRIYSYECVSRRC